MTEEYCGQIPTLSTYSHGQTACEWLSSLVGRNDEVHELSMAVRIARNPHPGHHHHQNIRLLKPRLIFVLIKFDIFTAADKLSPAYLALCFTDII